MINGRYKVSIITVVYNGAKTIEQTIKSVLEQTYTNIEYIVIDGGSDDGTQQIVEKYRDSIACFISEADDGIYDAMNKGIQLAAGDIIGFINSDDWYARDAVENAVSCFMLEEAEIVYGKVVNVYPGGEERTAPKEPLEALWYEMAVPHPTVFIKKDVYERFGVFCPRYRLGADYDLLLRLYSQHVKFGYVDRIIAYFRMGGLSTQGFIDTVEEHKNIAMEYIDFCPYKEEIMEKLEDHYKWSHFSAIIRTGTVLPELLRSYFREKPLRLIVFGTGMWGEQCYEVLNDSGMEIEFWADNDPSKWGQEIHGIKVISPTELENRKANVLIAVRGNGKEIKQQLEMLSNKSLKCISLKELEILFYGLKK